MTFKKIICVLLAIISVCILSACGDKESVNAPEATGIFSFTALSIGKADAFLLKTENHTVLIDAGEKKDGKEIINFLSDNGIEHLDYLIITHFDKDHVGGAAKVVENKETEEIIVPNYKGTNNEYNTFVSKLDEKGITPTNLSENMSFVLDDVLLEVYPPMLSSYSGDNDYSIVVSITHGENTFLFTGDAEDERLCEIAKQLNLPHTFLKVPHHGRYSKKTVSFIKEVNPQYALITCSEKHPADTEILNELSEIGSAVYFTNNGDVNVVSDGEKILINQ